MKNKWVTDHKFCPRFLKNFYVSYEIDEIEKYKTDLFFVDFKQKVQPFIPKELQGEGSGMSGNVIKFLVSLSCIAVQCKTSPLQEPYSA
jgi:hypothetical protein